MIRPMQRGFLTLWVGMVVAVTLALAAIAANRWVGSLFAGRHLEEGFWQRSMAESAAHLALAHLNASDTFSGLETDSMMIRVVPAAAAPPSDSPWVDLAAAEKQDWRTVELTLPGRRHWQAVVKAHYEPLFRTLVVANERIELQEIETSSYDSEFVEPGDPQAGEQRRWGDLIGGDVTLRTVEPRNVGGRILTGPGRRLVKDETYTAAGEVRSLAHPWPIPALPPWQGTVLPLPSEQTRVLPPGHYRTSSLYFQGAGRFTFAGPAVLHVEGNVLLGPHTVSTSTNRPADLVVIAGGRQVEVHLPFSGGIFAPEAEVTLHGLGDFYGAIVARTVRNDGRGRLAFDRALPRRTRGSRRFFRLVSLMPLERPEAVPTPSP